jgi:nitrogen regulatory protein PII 1
MIQAVIRPDREEAVAEALAQHHFPAMTKWDVVGRGRQGGIRVGSQSYDELAKSMVMLVINDDEADMVSRIIREAAFSGYTGDGKIFVGPVEEAYTIRTGAAEL